MASKWISFGEPLRASAPAGDVRVELGTPVDAVKQGRRCLLTLAIYRQLAGAAERAGTMTT